MCSFSLVVDHDLLKDTYTDGVRSTSYHVSRLVFLFSWPPKFFIEPFEFLLYKTNGLHFSVCAYCNRSQKTSQRVKKNSHATLLFFTRCDVLCDLLQCTQTGKCNLFVN